MTRESTQQPLACSTVVERLIGGERASADAALNEHVGSCLTCFRTASDLRGLPSLRRQLKEAQSALPDPGAAFWASFPAQLANTWERHLERASETAKAAEIAKAVASASEEDSWVQRIAARAVAWLRLPIPAACTGALAAFAVVLVVMRMTPGGTSPSEGQLAAHSQIGSLGSDDIVAGGKESTVALDESLRELDVSGLRKLQAELEQTLVEGVRPRAVDGEDQVSGDPAALADDLDELSETGLAVLAEDLGESI